MALVTSMLTSTTVTLTPVVIKSGTMTKPNSVVWRAFSSNNSTRYADETFVVALPAAGTPDFIAGKAFQIDLMWSNRSGRRPRDAYKSISSARHKCGPLRLTFPITTSTCFIQRFRAHVPRRMTSASLAGWLRARTPMLGYHNVSILLVKRV